jgi:transcription elongation factor Elf1
MSKHHPPREEPLATRKQVFTCPHCGERISMVLDLSAGYQRYIEDCEVCCNPVEITYEAEEGVIVAFRAGIP